jgi:hypothetical protein
MSSLQRRFEILLPRRFNDTQPVPDELLADTVLELRQRFGAISHETQVIRGTWEQAGLSFLDDLNRLFIDVDDTPENRQFFVDYKERLKSRFKQIDIRITTYLVEAY